MTLNPEKIASWNGKNKARVRLYKKHDVEMFLQNNPEIDPGCLTFAGAHAFFERLLVSNHLVKAGNIFTIQTYEKLAEKHNGREILDILIKTQKKYLGGMKIWPFNFRSFTECYKLSGCSAPENNNTAEWTKEPLYTYMKRVLNAKPVSFNVLDLDFCGIFNENNSESVINLFKNDVLDNSGVAFVTHQKGRDVRGGKLFNILNGYLKTSPYVAFDSIPHINEKAWDTYVARYILIPLFYMCNAYENGYILKMERLIEYRDKNKGSGLAVNMLQYFFSWKRIASHKEATSDEWLIQKRSLVDVIEEEYTYLQWID
jgi:hypothetical protein